MTSLFYTTQSTKYPLDTVAPYLQSGNKLPYNLKVVRGYATLAVAATTYVFTDWNTGTTICLKPNSAILAIGVTRSVAGGGGSTITFGYSADSTAPALAGNNYAIVTTPVIDLGIVCKSGTVGQASQATCTGESANASSGYFPAVLTDGVAISSPITIICTFLVLEMTP